MRSFTKFSIWLEARKSSRDAPGQMNMFPEPDLFNQTPPAPEPEPAPASNTVPLSDLIRRSADSRGQEWMRVRLPSGTVVTVQDVYRTQTAGGGGTQIVGHDQRGRVRVLGDNESDTVELLPN